MSSNLLGDLANASKALNAHRFGVTTAGTNLANVNNPDYARQRVALGEAGTIQTMYGPRGMGVEVIGFEHMRDQILDREILRETSLNSSLEAQQGALAKAEANIGQEIIRSGDSASIDSVSQTGSGGVSDVLNDFFNAFHALSANPGSEAEKEVLLHKAEILAEKLNITSERFSDLQASLTEQVKGDVASANRLIDEIARLNVEIARAEATGAGQALSLRDQRQARLQDLSEYMQIKVENIEGSTGQIRVYVPSVGGETPTVDLVNRGHTQRVEFDDSGLTPRFSLAGGDPQIAIRGGSIHGALQARDGSIAEYMRGLDTLAEELVTQVNGLYNSGAAPGNTNFFSDTGDAAEFTAAGIRLDAGLNASNLRTTNAAAQEQGDNTLALAIAELDDAKNPNLGNRTFSDFYRSSLTSIGESTAKVDARMEDQSIVFKLLKEQQDAVSGVSIDEEMTDMMKFQRAYEATGKLIRVIDEMLDVIVNRLI